MQLPVCTFDCVVIKGVAAERTTHQCSVQGCRIGVVCHLVLGLCLAYMSYTVVHARCCVCRQVHTAVFGWTGGAPQPAHQTGQVSDHDTLQLAALKATLIVCTQCLSSLFKASVVVGGLGCDAAQVSLQG